MHHKLRRTSLHSFTGMNFFLHQNFLCWSQAAMRMVRQATLATTGHGFEVHEFTLQPLFLLRPSQMTAISAYVSTLLAQHWDALAREFTCALCGGVHSLHSLYLPILMHIELTRSVYPRNVMHSQPLLLHYRLQHLGHRLPCGDGFHIP